MVISVGCNEDAGLDDEKDPEGVAWRHLACYFGREKFPRVLWHHFHLHMPGQDFRVRTIILDYQWLQAVGNGEWIRGYLSGDRHSYQYSFLRTSVPELFTTFDGTHRSGLEEVYLPIDKAGEVVRALLSCESELCKVGREISTLSVSVSV